MFKNVPVDVAFNVALRHADGREWPLSDVTAKAGQNLYTGASGKAEGLAPGAVDVLLRPSRAAAERSVDVSTYWGRPVIFRGVVVQASTTRPMSSDDRDPAVAEALGEEAR